MNKSKFWLDITVFLFLVSLGCSFSNAVIDIHPPRGSGEIIYKDDFSKDNSGWITINDGESFIRYEYGGMRIFVNEPFYDYWSLPEKYFRDVRIEVEAAKLGGPDNNDFGIVCRFKDGENFYAFLVSSDGYAGIIKVIDSEYHLISAEEMTYSEKIRKGASANYLRADCIGSNLLLFVNEEKILQAQDSDFNAGKAGIIAGTNDTPGVDLFFDNFIVYSP